MKITIRRSELRFRPYRSSGPGGQHRNTTLSAMEVTHLPTGIKATASLKSQHQSKKAALRVLLSCLLVHSTPEQERFRAGAERVRTYHEPDNRVTDHRCGLQFSYGETGGKGDLSRLIEARAEALACADALDRLSGR